MQSGAMPSTAMRMARTREWEGRFDMRSGYDTSGLCRSLFFAGLLDDAEAAIRLEIATLDLRELRHALLAQLLLQVAHGEHFGPEIPPVNPTVLHQKQRRGMQER